MKANFVPHKDRLLPLDGLRGYAVLAVFFVHYIPPLADWLWVPMVGPFHGSALATVFAFLASANYGVYIFFVLSGFLIGRIFTIDPGLGYGVFMARRAARIYPAFLVSLLISGAIGIFYTGRMSWSVTTFVQNLLFLNGWFALGEIASYNFVTWSLFYELVFYLVVPLGLVPLARAGFSRTTIVAVTLAVLWLTSIVLNLTDTFLFFAAGVAVACIDDDELKRLADRIPEWILIPVYLLVVASYSLGLNWVPFVPFYMVAAAAVLVKAAYGDGLLNRLFGWSVLRRLGRISYSFYLLHATACVVFFYTMNTYFQYAPRRLTAWLSLPAVFLLSWLAAEALYRVAERPYFRRRATAEPSRPIAGRTSGAASAAG